MFKHFLFCHKILSFDYCWCLIALTRSIELRCLPTALPTLLGLLPCWTSSKARSFLVTILLGSPLIANLWWLISAQRLAAQVVSY